MSVMALAKYEAHSLLHQYSALRLRLIDDDLRQFTNSIFNKKSRRKVVHRHEQMRLVIVSS